MTSWSLASQRDWHPHKVTFWAKRDQAGEIYELLQQQLFTDVKVLVG